MIPVNSQIAAMLRTAIRAPRAYAWMQIPLITDATLGTVDYMKLGSQIVLDKVLGMRVTHVLEPGSDALDLKISNQDGSLSPVAHNSSLGRYFFPGAVDNKIAAYLGLSDSSGNETIVPAGIYIAETVSQKSTLSSNEMNITALDNFSMFKSPIYAQFPPRLFGNQTSNYFNPGYALKNPSGDGLTWTCDAINWMVDGTTAPVFASEFAPVTVYVGTAAAPAGTPTSLLFTIDYVHGSVTFNSPLSSDSVVSVDATPLAMAPEQMLYHLFVDYGNLDPTFLKFDCSGIMLPRLEIARERPILDIAKDIANATATRGVKWILYFDELGYLNFRELNMDAAPTATLTDERDILSISPEYNARDIQNVVRATGTSINNQPITVVSYDVTSIKVFSQKATYDIPATLLSTIKGMDPGTAVTYMSGLTSSALFERSSPLIQTEVEVLFNPLYETGDVISIREKRTGLQRDFYIDQITTEVAGPDPKQTLRIQEFKKSQDYSFGIASFFGSPNPQSGQNASQGQTGIISQVFIAGTQVVKNGQPVTDSTLNPLVASWNGGSLPITISTITAPTGAQIALWRWIYIGADAYVVTANGTMLLATGDGEAAGIYPQYPVSTLASQRADLTGAYFGVDRIGKSTLPYDFRGNFNTQNSRRFFWPLIRCSDWIAGDGILGAGGTLNSTWNGGVGVSGNIQLYGNLRVGLSDYFGTTTSGYKGVALYATGTPAANNIGNSSTSQYGVDFGVPVTPGTMVYGIHQKQTPCYLVILAATNAGSFQFKRIPFQLAL